MAEETFVAYQKDPLKRKALNDLMESTFHFSFEPWYQSGYWNSDYKPYSIFDGDQIIANVGAYRMELTVGRRHYTALQLGAVTSIESYRGKHRVSALFDTVFRENLDVDFFFLYAETTASSFYPRFGFHQEKAYYTEKVIPQNNQFSFRHLDFEKDKDIILRMAKYGVSHSRLRMENDLSLRMFCLPFYKDKYYYDDLHSVLVVGEKKENKYCLDAIVQTNLEDTETIVGSFISEPEALVRFHFLPEIPGGELAEDETILMVRPNKRYDIPNFLLGPFLRT